MQDNKKTKLELIAELEDLREKLKKLEEISTNDNKKENKLQELKKHFEHAFENTDIGISLISSKMEILSLNKQMKEWFPDINVLNHSLCYKSFNNPPLNKPCLYCPAIKTVENGLSHESIIETPVNGKTGNYNIISSPIKNENGEVVAVIEIVKDITRHKESETALKESEERYKELFNNMRSGVAVYKVIGDGENFIFKDFNKAGEMIDNDKKENLIGRSIFEVRHGVKEFGLIDAFKRVLKTGNAEHFPIKQYKDERISGWYENYIYKLPSGEIAVIFDNVTEIKQAEEALKISEARFRELIKSVTDYIYTVKIDDGKQISTLHSPGCLNVTGYTAKEFERDKDLWYKIIFSEDKESVIQKIKRIMTGELNLIIEHRIIHKDGSIRWVRNTPVVQQDSNGEIIAYDGLISDITGQKIAEEKIINLNKELEKRVEERTSELTTSNKELEAFSYSVSHDLKTPLRIIMGFSQLLLEEYGEKADEKLKGYLQKINLSAVKMSLLIDDLLNLSRITKTEMYKTSFDLSKMSKSIMEELNSQRPERKVKFVSPEKLIITADPNLIKIAIKNLLENSWKYTSKHKNSQIELGILKSHGEDVYYVKDDGVGFDMNYANKLFIPFQRLHASTDYEGTGIGLAIVHRIISKHGGKIWVESTEEKGTTIYFTL